MKLFFIFYFLILSCKEGSNPVAPDSPDVANIKETDLGGSTGFPEQDFLAGGSTLGGGNVFEEPTGNLVSGVVYREESSSIFVSARQNSTDNPEVDFSCPGDSFLLGEKSEYRDGDRLFRFYCQFLRNEEGYPVQKKQCEWSQESSAGYINYVCPVGKFLAGQKSRVYTRKVGGKSFKDRFFSYECCGLSSKGNWGRIAANSHEELQQVCTTIEERVPAQVGLFYTVPIQNLENNTRYGPVDYSCANAHKLPLSNLKVSLNQLQPIPNTLLRQVTSALNYESGDRRYGFFCCAGALEEK